MLVALLSRTQSELQAQVISLANQGIIDPIANLNGSKSFVFQGGLDLLVLERECIKESYDNVRPITSKF